jgi:hypothetical protein
MNRADVGSIDWRSAPGCSKGCEAFLDERGQTKAVVAMVVSQEDVRHFCQMEAVCLQLVRSAFSCKNAFHLH